MRNGSFADGVPEEDFGNEGKLGHYPAPLPFDAAADPPS